MINKNLLIIFVKNPVPGKVKTRLAETVGEDEAARIYRQLLIHTKHAVEPLQVDRQVWYASEIAEQDGWSTEYFEKKLQQGNDLGERMAHAFETAFNSSYKKVIIIGSDCAELNTEILEKAFKALAKDDIVLGPALDGGYYLIGMSRFHPALFNNITWSTSEVLKETIVRAKQHDLSIYLMTELNDIDTEADWKKTKNRLQITKDKHTSNSSS